MNAEEIFLKSNKDFIEFIENRPRQRIDFDDFISSGLKNGIKIDSLIEKANKQFDSAIQVPQNGSEILLIEDYYKKLSIYKRIQNNKNRIQKLKDEGRYINGKQVSIKALINEPYRDIAFKCNGCGKDDLWTAEQQRRHFEEQKGEIHSESVWCYDCHLLRIQEKLR